MKDYKALEILVATIQSQLAPDAKVIHNTKLPGRNSGVDRQIDVLVRDYVGQYEILIVIDAKDYKTPVDVKGVEEFDGLVADVGAHKGVLVCPAGFTAAAKTRAQGPQIDLYSPIDTDPHKWQVRPTLPMICDFRGAALSFRLQFSDPKPIKLAQHFFSSLPARNAEGKDLGVPADSAIAKWNEGRYPSEPGHHKELPVFETAEVFVDNGYGEQVQVTLTVDIIVERHLFYGCLPITKVSGFHDHKDNKLITNAFTTGALNPNEVWETWQRIDSADKAPTRPVMTLIGLLAWDIS